MSPELGRILLIVGIVLVVVGGLAVLGVRLPFGRLPGDIVIEGEHGASTSRSRTMIVDQRRAHGRLSACSAVARARASKCGHRCVGAGVGCAAAPVPNMVSGLACALWSGG